MSVLRQVKFVALADAEGNRDGEYGWQVLVDGKEVIPALRNKDTDVADCALEELWEALGINIEFDFECH